MDFGYIINKGNLEANAIRYNGRLRGLSALEYAGWYVSGNGDKTIWMYTMKPVEDIDIKAIVLREKDFRDIDVIYEDEVGYLKPVKAIAELINSEESIDTVRDILIEEFANSAVTSINEFFNELFDLCDNDKLVLLIDEIELSFLKHRTDFDTNCNLKKYLVEYFLVKINEFVQAYYKKDSTFDASNFTEEDLRNFDFNQETNLW